jgi:hypothetical protein
MPALAAIGQSGGDAQTNCKDGSETLFAMLGAVYRRRAVVVAEVVSIINSAVE